MDKKIPLSDQNIHDLFDFLICREITRAGEKGNDSALMEIVIEQALRKGLPGRATEHDLMRLSLKVTDPIELRLTLRRLPAVEKAKHLAELLGELHRKDFFSLAEISHEDTFRLFLPFIPDPQHFSPSNIREQVGNLHITTAPAK